MTPKLEFFPSCFLISKVTPLNFQALLKSGASKRYVPNFMLCKNWVPNTHHQHGLIAWSSLWALVSACNCCFILNLSVAAQLVKLGISSQDLQDCFLARLDLNEEHDPSGKMWIMQIQNWGEKLLWGLSYATKPVWSILFFVHGLLFSSWVLISSPNLATPGQTTPSLAVWGTLWINLLYESGDEKHRTCVDE